MGGKAQGLRLEDFYELLWGKPTESRIEGLPQAGYCLKFPVSLDVSAPGQGAFRDCARLVFEELQYKPEEEYKGSITKGNPGSVYLDDIGRSLFGISGNMDWQPAFVAIPRELFFLLRGK